MDAILGAVRVLRLGNSNDHVGAVPADQQSWKVAERAFSEQLGEPVETILKRVWPNSDLPTILDRWVTEFEPDLVVLQVNNFWYGHESAPLWLDRRFGRAG